MTPLAALTRLLNLKLIVATNAANLRGFGFVGPDLLSAEAEWFLHIQCAWRIETGSRIITGSDDWWERALDEDDENTEAEWDPASGGSLQEKRLRELFQDEELGSRIIQNRSDKFLVKDVSVSDFGNCIIQLSDDFIMRIFPSSSFGEYWRVFKKNDLESHFVCRASETMKRE